MVERRGGRRSGSPGGSHRYPRTARVNHVLQQVIATEIERISDRDPRLARVTVTGVTVDPDLRRAVVWLDSLNAEAREALADDRVRLQAAIARQVRLKRTPLLSFTVDPAVAEGTRIEDIIRHLPPAGDGPAGDGLAGEGPA